jgi:CDP-diacylglycerol--glycerol-3-phosphate 3-phosphatidyltransferase
MLTPSANLSSAYFTNRQDRYIHFTRNASLLSYLSSLLRLFTQYSYYLSPSPPPSASPHHLIPLTEQRPGPSLVWPSPSLHPRQFTSHAQATLTAFQRSWHASNPARARRIDVDTWFYPVIQAGTIGIREEERGLGKVLQFANCDNIKVDLTSGYFGLYRKYKDAVLKSQAPFNVIAASPKVSDLAISLTPGQRLLRVQRVIGPDSRCVHSSRKPLPSSSDCPWTRMGRGTWTRCAVEGMGA